MNDCNLTLGERIADTLLKQGKTQTDLCNEIGMKTSTLNAIITGERKNPRIETIVPIAKGLNISLDYLLGLSDETSIDVELKTISKKTGISVDAIQNIKERTAYYRRTGNPKSIKKDLLKTLNIVLESEYLPYFLDECDKYFRYYPKYANIAYVYNTGRRDAKNDAFFTPYNKDEYHLDINVKDFFNSPDKTIISSKEYDNFLLDCIKSYIKSFKKCSYDFYKNNLTELEEIQKIKDNWQKELLDDKSHYTKERIKLKLGVLDDHIANLKYNINFYESIKKK